jgi:hypothetical protein
LIQPGSYPTLAMKGEAALLLHTLRSEDALENAARVVARKTEELKGAVLLYVDRLVDAAAEDNNIGIYEEAHEIRGLAETAGLVSAGRIANTLCRYLDAHARTGAAPERGLVLLQLDALTRAAHAQDEATRLGNVVADELEALVQSRIASVV